MEGYRTRRNEPIPRRVKCLNRPAFALAVACCIRDWLLAAILFGANSLFADLGRKPSQMSLQDIDHIFVLMLENRSFDHMLGNSGISGTDPATGALTDVDGLPPGGAVNNSQD